jgi:hypothetical protein
MRRTPGPDYQLRLAPQQTSWALLLPPGRRQGRLWRSRGAHCPAGERVADGGHRGDPVDGAAVRRFLLGGEHDPLGVVAGVGPRLVQQRGVRGRLEVEQP